jgi:exodeoxyribonuclease V alpha subunit
VPGRAGRHGKSDPGKRPPSNGAETAPQVPAAYLPPFHAAERGLASALLCLLAALADRLAVFREVDWDKALAWLRSRTGAPLARAKGAKVVLAAPTGRAAKPLAELTGTKRPPSTACCSCVQAASPRSMPPHRWTQIWWWWWTRPRWWT